MHRQQCMQRDNEHGRAPTRLDSSTLTFTSCRSGICLLQEELSNAQATVILRPSCSTNFPDV